MKRCLIALVISGTLFAFWGAAEAGIVSGESNFSVFLKAGGRELLKNKESSVLSDDGQRPYLTTDAVSRFDPGWGSGGAGRPVGDWFDGEMDGAPEVPEPATMIMLGSLATGLFGAARFKKKK